MGGLRITIITILALLSLAPQLRATEIKCTGDTEATGAEPPDGTGRGCVKHDEQGNQVRHGIWVEWYINGQKHSEGEYKDGKRVGVWFWWHTNGQKMQEGKYWGDIPVGTWSAWDEDGHKILHKPTSGATIDDFSKNLRKDFNKDAGKDSKDSN